MHFMMKLKPIAFRAALLLLAASSAPDAGAQAIAIRAGRLLDPESGTVTESSFALVYANAKVNAAPAGGTVIVARRELL